MKTNLLYASPSSRVKYTTLGRQWLSSHSVGQEGGRWSGEPGLPPQPTGCQEVGRFRLKSEERNNFPAGWPSVHSTPILSWMTELLLKEDIISRVANFLKIEPKGKNLLQNRITTWPWLLHRLWATEDLNRYHGPASWAPGSLTPFISGIHVLPHTL